MAQPQWRPYRFKGLPKYTRESAALLASFSRYLGVSSYGARLLSEVAKVATDVFREEVTLEFDHLRAMSFEEIAMSVPEYACLVRVGLQPKEEKVVWELDPVLAAALVERLLGGKGEDIGMSRPFTDIERGVLTYGILKIASAFQANLAQGSELAVRVEAIEQSIDPYRTLYQDDLAFHTLSIKASFGGVAAFSRVFVPHTLTAGAFSIPDEPDGSEGHWQLLRKNLSRVGEQWLVGRVKVATIDLAHEDIAALDKGDIVLIENHQLQGTGEALSGQADVLLGRAKNGVVRTQLLWRNGRCDLQISELALQQEPQNMSDEQDIPAEPVEVEEGGEAPAAPADNMQEAEGLLRDVPAPVVVELGRLKMSTSQVIRLKAGQILRLGRSPSDPVDLVVNNRIFARGELIEIDGELGVRLVQLAK
ncbi:MAG: FliM/FliN family flagellar motor switch protein [Deltaproteobacteria bacterium]|nr:FliM/FliN family flagellar motor switch protein [Deltaproteobacteria bacterium]